MSRYLVKLKASILRIMDVIYPFWLFKIKRNKIVASSFRGTDFSGNAALIVERLLKADRNLDIVWLSIDVTTAVPHGVRVVKYNSLASYYELATAHIWIDDFRKKYFPRKRKGQIYYQVWHGVLPLKKIERDAESKLDPMYVREAKRDGQNADFMVAGNDFTANIYRRSFWFKGEIKLYGTPSLDQLIQARGISESLASQLGIDASKKIVLYCPTFRDTFDVKDYTLDSKKLIAQLDQQLGGQWQLLIRLHPNIRKFAPQVMQANPSAIDVTDFSNLTELILSSEVVISDFSSVMFNALYADKPTFLFAPDYEDYISNERGVYSLIDELPFSISTETGALLRDIANYDENEYQARRETFLANIGDHESGHSAELLAKDILKSMFMPV